MRRRQSACLRRFRVKRVLLPTSSRNWVRLRSESSCARTPGIDRGGRGLGPRLWSTCSRRTGVAPGQLHRAARSCPCEDVRADEPLREAPPNPHPKAERHGCSGADICSGQSCVVKRSVFVLPGNASAAAQTHLAAGDRPTRCASALGRRSGRAGTIDRSVVALSALSRLPRQRRSRSNASEKLSPGHELFVGSVPSESC